MNSGILINLFSQCFHELSISGLRQPMALFCSHQLRFKLHNLTCPYGIPLLSGRSLGVINTTPETKRQSMKRWTNKAPHIQKSKLYWFDFSERESFTRTSSLRIKQWMPCAAWQFSNSGTFSHMWSMPESGWNCTPIYSSIKASL